MNSQRSIDKDEFVDWFRNYRDQCRWQAAKSRPPHEYTIRKWRRDAADDFEQVVIGIREFGYPQAFYKSTFVYFDLDGLKYWTMGAPIPETTVLNRDSVEHRFDRPSIRGPMTTDEQHSLEVCNVLLMASELHLRGY